MDCACTLLLQTEGKSPCSLVMPPNCPPMPKPQALQVFLARNAFAESAKPIRLTVCSVYRIFFAPPPTGSLLLLIVERSKNFTPQPSHQLPAIHEVLTIEAGITTRQLCCNRCITARAKFTARAATSPPLPCYTSSKQLS